MIIVLLILSYFLLIFTYFYFLKQFIIAISPGFWKFSTLYYLVALSVISVLLIFGIEDTFNAIDSDYIRSVPGWTWPVLLFGIPNLVGYIYLKNKRLSTHPNTEEN